MLKVTLLTHTPEPEQVVAAAAKLCYSSSTVDKLMDGLTPEKSKDFVDMLSTIGHESPIEHVSFTFALEGVSRAMLAQITRHRIASYSVQSQRYVGESSFDYVVPPEIASVPQAKVAFLKAMEEAQAHYNTIASILQQKHMEQLMGEGMDEKTARQKATKMAIEDARFVLPNACDTKIIMTINARSLMHFFRLRCCNRAQWEIRQVADQMLQLAYKVAPGLFKDAGPACVVGKCTEGKMTCGKIEEVRKAYQRLKEETA